MTGKWWSAALPVLVVGAGPAGLTTAITLARQGIETMVVERRHDRSGLPRATVVSTRSMELLRSWGLAGEVLAGGLDVEWRMWICTTLAEAAAGEEFPVGYPSREQAELISPTAPACVPQDHLEPVLLNHFRSLPAGRVDLGTELVAVHSGSDGVRVVLRDVVTGEPRTVHARYLVAADGAHSSVRAALDIPMEGMDDALAGVQVLFRAPLWDLLGEHRYGIYAITHPDAPGSLLPAGRGDRWLYGVRGLTDLGAEEATRLIRLATGIAGLEPRIEQIGAFSSAAALARGWRHGNVFLVGDAAHRVTPRGGTGMNLAIHGGFDLGWKLSWVLRGWAGEALLNTYEAERRPVAEHHLARSADPNGTLRGAGQELPADLDGRVPHVWVSADLSTVDLLGSGLTLFTGPDSAAWRAAAAAITEAPPVDVHALDPINARALGIREGGALLVRPDGTPAGGWPPGTDTASALVAAIRALAGQTVAARGLT